MLQIDKITNSKPNRWHFYIGYYGFVICHSLGLNQLKKWYLLLLKEALFYISGHCQMTGNCCRQITLRFEGKRVETAAQYEAMLQKKVLFRRFFPVYKVSDSEARIQYFNCSYLTEKNTCSDYKNRPQMCRNFPFQQFYGNTPMHPKCGYAFSIRTDQPSIRHPILKRYVRSQAHRWRMPKQKN